MEFVKTDLLKKFHDNMPIGLCSLGLKRKNKKNEQFKTIQFYPNFFTLSKSSPV